MTPNDESWQPSPFSPWHNREAAPVAEPLASEAELRELAEDIVQYAPSLCHLLLAMSPKGTRSPLAGLN